jgi:heme O synthase-like polyprenyltransferase
MLVLALLKYSWIYWFVFILRNYCLIKKVLPANRTWNEKQYRQVFGYSIVYSFGIFGALMIDGFLKNVLK